MAHPTSSPIDPSEAAEYYFTYIDKVPAGDIRRILEDQQGETLEVLRGITGEQSLHRYEAGKWSVREVVGHLNDTERLFTFRALWFARGITDPLPSFDQDVAAEHAEAHEREWSSLVDEFRNVRQATCSLFGALPEQAWKRRGIASGHPVTVRALAYITAGHVEHHLRILRERYL